MKIIKLTKRENGHQYALYLCACGKEKETRVKHVESGATKTCGCRFTAFTHGMSQTDTYHTWENMKARCLNSKNTHYENYGGRGITVCERWMKFENFLEDMGERPENKTLDRVDNDGNYEPSNCRWATKKQQQSNRKVTRFVSYKGKKRVLSELVDELGLKYNTVNSRICSLGWTPEEAIIT